MTSNSEPQIREEAISDLSRVANLTSDQIEKIAAAVGELHGFNGDEALIGAISPHCVSREEIQAVIRTLRSIAPDRLDVVREVIQENKDAAFRHLNDQQFPQLLSNLALLVRDYPALKIRRKADGLLRATGNEYYDVLIICDLRPVFDEDHRNVEGVVPLVTAKFTVRKQNNSQEVFEMTMSEDELDDLIREAEDAKRKLGVLREQGVPQ